MVCMVGHVPQSALPPTHLPSASGVLATVGQCESVGLTVWVSGWGNLGTHPLDSPLTTWHVRPRFAPVTRSWSSVVLVCNS